MKTVILVTGHYYGSRRRGGFHWLANAYREAGWRVIFFTAAISWLSWLKRDHRFRYPIREEAGKIRWLDENFGSYVWLTPWHPANLRSEGLNRLFTPLFRAYKKLPLGPVKEQIRQADLVIMESTPGLVLHERLRRLAPHARMVYRVSDDLNLLQNHPVVLEAEQRSAPQFDLVSVPSAHLLSRFGGLENVALHPHGLQIELFDREWPNPYQGDDTKLVFVGVNWLDTNFLEHAAKLFPSWSFHLLGCFSDLPALPNVINHGEVSFEETLPFLKHADIGLHIKRYKKGPSPSRTVSRLSSIRTSSCRLSCLGFSLRHGGTSTPYDPGDPQSIRQALLGARSHNRSQIDRSEISSWRSLAAGLADTPTALHSRTRR